VEPITRHVAMHIIILLTVYRKLGIDNSANSPNGFLTPVIA